MSSPKYFPLRWESTGDQWWYASPIDCAAANGHYELVRELLRLDGNHLIKLTSLRRIRRLETVWDDEHQFHDVAKHRSVIARNLLNECEIKRGKNSLIGAGYGGWLLYTAASAGDLIFVRELLERDPWLVFGEGEYGVTDILYAAARSKNDEVCKIVMDFAVSREVNLDFKREIVNRALHSSGRGGNLKLLKGILCEYCEDDALEYRDVQGATVLHSAAAKGKVEVVEYLASSPELITATDNHGHTALHVAAHRGHLPVVESLILASPELISARNNAGETFLHSAITGFQIPGFQRLDRQIQLMKHLFHEKISNLEQIINVQNNEGRTALHLAIIGNVHTELVELLMSARGIDVNIRDMDSLTPLDILRHRPNSASSELLTRQLISAGGIFSSRDYSERKVITSHLNKQIVKSPGTCFANSDGELFLNTGIENLSVGSGSARFSTYSSENFSPVSTKGNKAICVNSALGRIKRFLNWPKMRRTSSFEGVRGVPLRQRFLNTSSSLHNNKRVCSGLDQCVGNNSSTDV